jgi:hypothetical protein
MQEHRLLLISRDDILEISAGKVGNKLFRRLARLTRHGFQLLATASQPDKWSTDQNDQDNALLGPLSIRERIADEGGVLDGVYYVPRSSLTQRRNREEALQDMMTRYATSPGNCYLFSSSRKFVEAAADLGINATALVHDGQLMAELKALRNQTLHELKVTD